MTTPPSGPVSSYGTPQEVASRHRELVSDDSLDAFALRCALTELTSGWLAEMATAASVTENSGLALVVGGSLAAGEFQPYSDVDLMLLHDRRSAGDLAAIADRLWYPVWDAKLRLDHSVRTVSEALSVAEDDLAVAMELLRVRHVAGDPALSKQLISKARAQWRRRIASRFDDVVANTHTRWERAGRVADRVSPDVKNGRGGLRDIELLDALALGQLTDTLPEPAGEAPGAGRDDAHRLLVDIRTECHRAAGRRRDVLQPQDADEVAERLGIGDRFDLLRALSDASRTIAFAVDQGLSTADMARPTAPSARRGPQRRPVDEGVVDHGGHIALARDVKLGRDPFLPLRVLAASAWTGLPVTPATLLRLHAHLPAIPEPWPADALDDFLTVLGCGPRFVDLMELFDRSGLLGAYLPEWGNVRDLPPRDVVHAFTVDRHLVEVVVAASARTGSVDRPDLLLLAALLHDLGKGRERDHSEVGAELTDDIAARWGLSPDDTATVRRVVRHHLLLHESAGRKDVSDPTVGAEVADALDNDRRALQLLFALSAADSLGTGPGVWNDWKERMLAHLVATAEAVLDERGAPVVDALDTALPTATSAPDAPVHLELESTGMLNQSRITLDAPDSRGLIADLLAVLDRHGLHVRAATLGIDRGRALGTVDIATTFGDAPDPALLRQEMRTHRDAARGAGRSAASSSPGGLLSGIGARLRGARERVSAATSAASSASSSASSAKRGTTSRSLAYGPAGAPPVELLIRVLDGDSVGRGIEVRSFARPDVLAHLATAVADASLSITELRVATYGSRLRARIGLCRDDSATDTEDIATEGAASADKASYGAERHGRAAAPGPHDGVCSDLPTVRELEDVAASLAEILRHSDAG